jgi:hypothetical protein
MKKPVTTKDGRRWNNAGAVTKKTVSASACLNHYITFDNV